MEAKFRFVSPMERALYLRTMNPTSELAPDELALIAQRARERFHRKGTEIAVLGKPLPSFHIIVDGEISVNGAEHGRTILGPEESLGFFTMLSRRKEGLEAVAATDVTTLETDADDFLDVLEDQFSILHFVIRSMARTMLQERKQIEDGTYLAPAQGLLTCPPRKLDLVERLMFLRQGGVLRSANMDSLIELSKNMDEIRHEADEVLWRVADGARFLVIIVDGTVSCRLSNGRSFRAGPGYPLGNLESLAGEPRWYEAVTESPAVLLRGFTEGFMDILEDHFDVARAFLAANATGIITALEERRGRGRTV